MSIKVRHGEYEFELETEADLRAFMAAMKNGTAPISSAAAETIIQKMRRLYERSSQSPNQKRLVDLLAVEPEGLTDADIRSRLGFANNNVLGGVVANFRKNAYACGLTIEQVLSSREIIGSETAIRHYRLTPDMRDLVLAGRS